MISITKRFLLLSPLLMMARRAFGQNTPAPPAARPDDAALAAVATQAIEGYFLPAYDGLAEATARLVAALGNFCEVPAAAPTPAVRAAFEKVLLAFARVDYLRFGPMAEKGRLERFSFLPDPHGTGARQLRRILATPDPALIERGAVAKLSAAVQGLPALESLLFSGSSDTETLAYRCRLSLRIAENLDAIAKETLAGWTAPDGWRHLMENPGGDNIVYRDRTEPVVEILKAIGVGLLQLRDQRLLPSLGKSFATAKPGRAFFVKSGLTVPYLLASGDAIGSLIERSGLLALAPASAPALSAETNKSFDEYRAALDISMPWPEALGDEASYGRIRAGFDVLKTLEDIYNFRFPNAVGISPGFNALDGD